MRILRLSSSLVLVSTSTLSHVYPSLTVTPLDAAQGVIDFITSIRSVPQYFGCECLGLFVSRHYSGLTNFVFRAHCRSGRVPQRPAQVPTKSSAAPSLVHVQRDHASLADVRLHSW